MNIRRDLKNYLATTGLSINKLALLSGVSQPVLWRLANNHQKGVNSTTLDKLWPILYGPESPLTAPSEERHV